MSRRPPRSAGVTTAATFALLGSATAFFIWGKFFWALLNLPLDEHGRRAYETNPMAFLLISAVPPALIALGTKTGIGLFQLRSWARSAALIWAWIALIFCLAMIAFRPFETFVIPKHFVSELASLKQLIAISFVLFLLPMSVWWLFLFRMKSVKLQFQSSDSKFSASEQQTATKSKE